MRRQLEFPAKLLRDGDRLIWSQRYGTRLQGPVKVLSIVGNLVFLDSPVMAGEDVALQANETVRVMRSE